MAAFKAAANLYWGEKTMRLKDKIAVVTGSSRGIGKAIATRLAEEGASVAVNYRQNAAPAEELVGELVARGFKAKAFCADVSHPEDCHDLMKQVSEEFQRIDILVSNAGVEHFAPLQEITKEDFDRVFAINVGGQLFVTQAALPYLSNGSRIVLTSSISARISIFHHTLYAASKAAVSAMVLNLAPELGERGITINAVAPGGTATDMAKENAHKYTHPALSDLPPEIIMKTNTSLQRLAQPEEIAAVVAFLVSEDAAYITGSTVAIDGGQL
ncbi:MAG: SDR family oxidoreductase [Rhizonema sp. PD38]|nr:SDR family oxidoreductase [Rhizonema sp. PD38]